MRRLLTSASAHIQGSLFPLMREEVGPLTPQHERLMTVLDVARIEAFVSMWPGLPGRPPSDRHALARGFVAKAVLGLPQTKRLIERLKVDKMLRRLCGWETERQVPSKSMFARAFAEFAACQLRSLVHEAPIKKTHADRRVGHISRDATAVEAREKAVKTDTPEPVTPKRKRGRPRKGASAPTPSQPTNSRSFATGSSDVLVS